MKRRVLILVLILIILSQIPFAYRRYRLRRLHTAIEQLASQRSVPLNDSDYVDYQGAIHVHSSLGGHSTGTFADIIAAARANQLDFVIMTEHPQSEFDTSAMTLNGVQGNVMFINGNEVSTRDGDRLLLIPGSPDAASKNTETTTRVTEEQQQAGGLSVVAYPAESNNWRTASADAIEIYNLFSNARSANSLVLFFDGLWSFRAYPDLMFANFFARPSENLRDWDDTINNNHRKITAIAGNDAHANVGLSVNDAAGKQWLGVKLDPYERSFRVVRTHLFIKRGNALTREAVSDALRQGHCYISFDLFSNGKGFDFRVANGQAMMGDEVPFAAGLRLSARAALPSRFVLFRGGAEIDQKSGSSVEFPVASTGAYRVEAYLDSLPAPVRGQPWIISNPIYVK